MISSRKFLKLHKNRHTSFYKKWTFVLGDVQLQRNHMFSFSKLLHNLENMSNIELLSSVCSNEFQGFLICS